MHIRIKRVKSSTLKTENKKHAVLTQFIGGEKSLDLPEPEVQVLDGGDEGALAVGLLQLHGLLAGLLGEELPLLSDALQAVLHRLLATRALLPISGKRWAVRENPTKQCFGSA